MRAVQVVEAEAEAEALADRLVAEERSQFDLRGFKALPYVGRPSNLPTNAPFVGPPSTAGPRLFYRHCSHFSRNWRGNVKNPEQQARQNIDAALEACGWVLQDYEQMNLAEAHGVAVREFPLASGFGRADYALYVDEELVGAIEAKKEGISFASFETQTQK